LGFAVVADEVRNLARRSAEAAKETALKIEGAITRTAQGVELSGKVSQTLNDIVTKARQVDELAAEVAGASREQTEGIAQINAAVGQMDKVTQSNAASAEESAAAAAELNAQAGIMKQSVAELMELVGGAATSSAALVRTVHHQPAVAPRSRRPELPELPPPTDSGIVAWNEEKMVTGVQTVDAQHRELIQRINELHADCIAGKAREELMEHLNFLGSYVQSHFAHEEKIMAEHRCPSRSQNEQAHAKFLQDYEQVVAMVQENGATSKAAIVLKRMLGDWLTSHICRIDTGLRNCAAAQTPPAANRRGDLPLAGDFKDF
jgi:hemerythrin-like metal-binding protein